MNAKDLFMAEREMLTASPTAPNPKTATVEPFGGFATLRVAPSPKEENQRFELESIIRQVINRICRNRV